MVDFISDGDKSGHRRWSTLKSFSLLVLVSLIAVLAFQWPGLLYTEADSMYKGTDVPYIRAGIEQAQATTGTGVWWHSQWPHTLAHFYRPIAGFAHMGQLYIIDNYGYREATVLMMAVFAFTCALTGCLAVALAGDSRVGMPAAIGMAAFTNGTLPANWTGYWPLADNLICFGFYIASALAFVSWMRRPSWHLLGLTWLALAASCCTKEMGYTAPLAFFFFAISLPVAPAVRRAALVHCAALASGAVLICLYARAVAPLDPRNLLFFPIDNIVTQLAFSPDRWYLSFVLIGLVAIFGTHALRHKFTTPFTRLAWGGGLLFAVAVAMLLSPAEGLPRGAYALVHLVDIGSALLAGTIVLAMQIVVIWYFAKYRPLWLAALAAGFVTVIPLKIGGVGLIGGRMIFPWAFWVIAAVLLVAEAIRHRNILFSYVIAASRYLKRSQPGRVPSSVPAPDLKHRTS